MSHLFHIRLQGGPYDGERIEGTLDDLPDRLYIERCKSCGFHVSPERISKAEVYRRDDRAIDGYHIYVYTDERLGAGHPFDRAREKEPVTA